LRAGVDQLGDALARGQSPLFVLRFDGFRAAARCDLLFFVLDLRDQVNHPAGILLKFGRLRIYVGFENRGSHSQTSRGSSGAKHAWYGSGPQTSQYTVSTAILREPQSFILSSGVFVPRRYA